MLSSWLASAAQLARSTLDKWCGNPFVGEANASDDLKERVLRGDAAQLIAQHLSPAELSALARTRPLKTHSEKLAVDYLWALMAARDFTRPDGSPIQRVEEGGGVEGPSRRTTTWLDLLRQVRAAMVEHGHDIARFWHRAYFHLSAAVRLAYILAFDDITRRLLPFGCDIKWADDQGRHAVREPNTQFAHLRAPANPGDDSLLAWVLDDSSAWPGYAFEWENVEAARDQLLDRFGPVVHVKITKWTPPPPAPQNERNKFNVITRAYSIKGSFPVFQLSWVDAGDALALHNGYPWYEAFREKSLYWETNVVDAEHHSIEAYDRQHKEIANNIVVKYLSRDSISAKSMELHKAFAAERRPFHKPATLYLNPAPASTSTPRLTCSYCKAREATVAIFPRSLHQLEEGARFACDTCKH